jgi:hypothetical protein
MLIRFFHIEYEKPVDGDYMHLKVAYGGNRVTQFCEKIASEKVKNFALATKLFDLDC